MARKSALGDALDSIFDDFDGFDGGSSENGIQLLKIGDIEPNREQPRKVFDNEKLELLADSISQHGMIQPLTVRETQDGVYQIVAGERRWRAARLAGIAEVPVRIMDLSDVETMQIALIENLQREDLNPVEEASGYFELIEKYSMTQDKLAKVVGRARSSVANSLRLLMLPEEVLELVRKNLLSKGHCKAIMSASGDVGSEESVELMVSLAKRAATGELSVRETEKLAKEIRFGDSVNGKGKRSPDSVAKKPSFFIETELALSSVLNTKVRITQSKNNKKKTLCIDFSNEEELKNIVGRF